MEESDAKPQRPYALLLIVLFALVGLFAVAMEMHFGQNSTEGGLTSNEVSARISHAPEEDIAAIVAGNNRLAFDLLRGASPNTLENAGLATWNITTAFGPVWAGARGTTETDLATALHFTLPQERHHEAVLAVRGALINDRGSAALRNVSRLWKDDQSSLLAPFRKLAKDAYGADVEVLDLEGDPEGSMGRINGWLEDQTMGTIPAAIPRETFNGNPGILLTTAFLFEAKWEHIFRKGETRDGHFTTEDGRKVIVKMMSNTSFHYQSYEDAELQALELAYRDSKLAMLFVLPAEGTQYSDFESGMNADKLDLIVTNLTKTFLSVNIPKFGFDSRSDLAKFLADQGAQVALDDRADFSAMDGTHGLPLKSALHLTHIRVDEEGTTASAASIMDKAAGGSNIHFTADRPFLFLIRDRETGTVLFIGRVADPS